MNSEEIQVGDKIRKLRKEQELSQEDLAEALGVSRQSVIALEQNKYMPSLPLAVEMCRFFNSAFEDIFEIEREIDKAFGEIENNINNNINGTDARIGIADESVKRSTMNDMEPYRPFREMVTLRDAMDRLFEDSVIPPVKGGGMPKIDIKDKKESVEVKAELPGIEEDNVEIEIHDNVMTISGSTSEKKEEDQKDYYYRESHSGSFARSFTLPSEVVADKAEAEIENGVLLVTVPKIKAKTPKKVSVKAKRK